MKLLILALTLAYASADVSHILAKAGVQARDAQITQQSLDLQPEGSYHYAYETENGIAAHEFGDLKTVPGSDNQVITSHGQAQWTSDDGQVINLSYVADENGYQPQGAHLPTPPPIPEAILKALEYIRTHPPAPERR